ncbi:MAG: hypothetical protein ACFKPT_03745 [Gloeotrichia echinulata GP01]
MLKRRGTETQFLWIRNLLVLEIVLWTGNYVLDLSQIAMLLRWEVTENSDISIN